MIDAQLRTTEIFGFFAPYYDQKLHWKLQNQYQSLILSSTSLEYNAQCGSICFINHVGRLHSATIELNVWKGPSILLAKKLRKAARRSAVARHVYFIKANYERVPWETTR